MVRYREYIQEKEKKLSAKDRARRRGGAVVAPRTEAEERAALRAEYFRKSSGRSRKTYARQERLIDAQ